MNKTIIKPKNTDLSNDKKVLRVCAYCRVSTSSKAQLHSYEAQLTYYKRVSLAHTNWLLIDIYADAGITGRSSRNRDRFNEMIEDAMDGMFDMILCKSISRFSRDVVTTLEICRALKEKGIDVYFEKENIHTLFLSNEEHLTYYAYFAQSESESLSKNVRWATQKRMKKGTWLPIATPYGYVVSKKEVVKEKSEEETVNYIFGSFINGLSASEIAEQLNQKGIKTRNGSTWGDTTIIGMLKNPIYYGELVAQKTFIDTFSSNFEKKKNDGQLPKYRYIDNHEPYINKKQKEKVLEMLAFRRTQKNVAENSKKYISTHVISNNLYCHECGSTLKRIKAKQNKEKAYFAYACKNHRTNNKACSFVAIKEDTIKNAFIKMTNKLIYHRDILSKYLVDVRMIAREVDTGEINELEQQLEKLYMQADNARNNYYDGNYDREFYEEIMNMVYDSAIDLRSKHRNIKEKYDVSAEIGNTIYIQNALSNYSVGDSFHENLYKQIIQEAQAIDKQTIQFTLINGLEIQEGMKRL